MQVLQDPASPRINLPSHYGFGEFAASCNSFTTRACTGPRLNRSPAVRSWR